MRTLRLLALAWVVGGTTAVIHGEEAPITPQKLTGGELVDQQDPNQWNTLVRFVAQHDNSIEIVSTWIELVDNKTGDVFARKRVVCHEQGNAFIVVIAFRGAHLRHTVPTCIIEYRELETGKVQKVIFPSVEGRKLEEKIEEKEIPEELKGRKPAPRKRPSRPREQAVV